MTWYFQQCGMCNQQRLRPACAYAQTDQTLCWSLEYSMTVKLLTDPIMGFLSLTRGCTGSSEATLVKMPHCWKSRVAAQMCLMLDLFLWGHLSHYCDNCVTNYVTNNCTIPFGQACQWKWYYISLGTRNICLWDLLAGKIQTSLLCYKD